MLTKKNSTKAQRRQQAIAQLTAKSSKGRRTTKRRGKPRRAGNRMRSLVKPHPYATCRLTPFQSKGNALGIPDATNTRRLVVDHRLFTTLTFGSSGTLDLALVPALPSPVWVYPADSTMRINGQIHGENINVGVMIPLVLSEWDSILLSYFDGAGNYNDVAALYGSNKFRIVTYGWSLSYLGTSLTDSGMIKVTSAGLTLGDAIPNVHTFEVYSSKSGTNTNFQANQVLTRPMNAYPFSLDYFNAANTYDTVMTPLRKGASGVLRHSGADYEYQTLSSNMTYVSAPQNNNLSAVQNYTPTPNRCGNAGVTQGWDNGWDTTVLSISGGTTGQSVMLDLIVCVEYAPTPNSTSYTLAKMGPPTDPKLMESVEKQARDMPLAKVGAAVSEAITIGKTVASIATAFV